MKDKARITINLTTLGEATLDEICQLEENNRKNFTAILNAELPYFNRLRQLHESAVEILVDDRFVSLQLMRDAGNSFVSSGITILRGHVVEACAIYRRAVEAAAFGYKTRDPKKAQIWIREKTGAKAYGEELRKWKFPKNHVALNELGQAWTKLCDIGSHASLASQVFRFETRGERSTSGYFDIGDQPVEDYRLIFNWMLGTHIRVLDVFAEVLDKSISEKWKEQYRKFKSEYREFGKKCVLPKVKPNTRETNRTEEFTPGGIIMPRPGDLAKLLLQRGRIG